MCIFKFTKNKYFTIKMKLKKKTMSMKTIKYVAWNCDQWIGAGISAET